MGQFSLTHLLILAVIMLLFFGPSRLPQLGQSLGRAIRGFKSGLSGEEEEEEAKKPRSVGTSTNSQIRPPEDVAQNLHESATNKDRKDPHNRG
jgi:TatA/E family protein of Tat protein translocase